MIPSPAPEFLAPIAMSTDIILETKHLTIGYRHAGRADVVVSHDLDLRLRRGELVCLLGPNEGGASRR
ncbi:MAG: hypothetical protein R2873_09615 [Caldilineaceae bacterium]